jgi:hypothetical protein
MRAAIVEMVIPTNREKEMTFHNLTGKAKVTFFWAGQHGRLGRNFIYHMM